MENQMQVIEFEGQKYELGNMKNEEIEVLINRIESKRQRLENLAIVLASN